jgi:TonB-dependent starch-binding outer membrane protein SusC
MKRILSILAFIALAVNAFAQQSGYEVKGTVQDQIGPVIGASVIEVGTMNGTTTDLDGNFVLKVSSAEAMVEVSCVGYTTQTFKASQVPAVITLAEDNEFLDEVVVIGYGTVRKSDMTGSVAAVKADQLNKGVVTSPTDLLQGKSAGVVVTAGDGAPGSASTIRIRGGSSLKANNNPLVVIDGLPISEVSISGVSDAMSSINPNDIESFTVLKDASATAIFGSRASNGVIMITTKKGSKYQQGIHVDADFTASLSQNAKYVDVLTGDEMRSLMASYIGTDGAAYAALGSENTNWQKQIYQLGQTYDENVSLSGKVSSKNDKFYMPYRVSLGFHSQEGTLKTSKLLRETLSVNLTPTLLNDHLTINLNGKGMNMDTRFANQDAIGAAVRMDPTQPVYDESGLNGYWWWHYDRGTTPQEQVNTMAGQNPVALLNDKRDVSNAKRFIGNAQLNYKVHGFEALSFNVNLGLDVSDSDGTVDADKNTEQSLHATAQLGSGYHSIYSQKKQDTTLEAYGQFDKTFGRHYLNLMAGYSWQHFYNETYSETYKVDGTKPTEEDYYLSDPYTFKTEYYLVSFFGRLNYSLNDRLLLTATLRNDGTSRFSNNKWGLFPSVALSYNFAKLNCFAGSDKVSALKLRLSWGQTGQQDLQSGNYPTLATYVYNTNASMYTFGNSTVIPITAKGYNADLKWETTTTYNAGIDLGFFQDRITASIDVYQRDTKDLLNRTPVSAGANLSNYLDANIGNLTNKGIEFDLNVIPVQTSDWRWTVGFNASYNRTKITKLTTDDEREDYYGITTGGISGGTGNTIQVHQTGYAPNSFFVYQQVYDTDGNPIEGLYVDRNGDGQINDNDKYCFHKAAPDWTFGFNTQLAWKKWTLAMSAHANVGNYVYNNISSNGDLLTDLWANNFVSNRYSTAKQHNFRTYAQYFSDMYVQDASFLKIDNVTLSRAFNLGLDHNRILNFNVFATVQNLACFTKYDGIDPEIFSGIDNNMYPRPRTYVLGVKFNF